MRNSENEEWLQRGEPGKQSEGGGLGWAGAGEAEPPGMGGRRSNPAEATGETEMSRPNVLVL